MFDPKTFQFDPEKMAEFFKTNDFTKMMSDAKIPMIDTEALMAAQKRNMDALVEANKAAAAGYQELFAKQVSLFEGAMEEARNHVSEFDASKMTPEAASAAQDVTKAAFEKAIAHMTELAETARKANTEAYEIVSARLKDSMSELQDMASKAGK